MFLHVDAMTNAYNPATVFKPTALKQFTLSLTAGINLQCMQQQGNSFCRLMDCSSQRFCFFISFNANRNPTANNNVITPAKYGIISVIFSGVYEF